MTVFRRFATVAVAGVVFAAAAAAQEKKDKADSQVPTADLTPVWVVMDHAMDGTGGIQSGYGTSTYDVSSGATATDLKVEPVAAEDSPTIEFRNDVIKGQEGKVYVPFQLLINRDKITTKTLVISTRMAPKGATGPEAAPAAAAPADKSKNAKAAPGALAVSLGRFMGGRSARRSVGREGLQGDGRPLDRAGRLRPLHRPPPARGDRRRRHRHQDAGAEGTGRDGAPATARGPCRLPRPA